MREHPVSRPATGHSQTAWRVWDTHHAALSARFQFYREGACSSFMPLSPERPREREFSARIETLSVGSGTLTSVNATPHLVLRTPRDLTTVDPNFVHLNIVLSGGALLEQGGREQSLRVGDIVLFDTARPFSMQQYGDLRHHVASLLISKRDLEIGSSREDLICNARVSQGPVGEALRATMRALMTSAMELPASEVETLYDACIALCSVSTGIADRDEPSGAGSSLYLESVHFVEKNIAEPDLSAEKVARHFGVSARYIHKVFARAGASVGDHVMRARLKGVRIDLTSASMRQMPISSLAYRWGFNDLSTFNRHFKQRYGMTPSQLRQSIL
jgi:AraC-like DNA-binding protein